MNYFFERFEFLVCSCACAVACLHPRNSNSNVVASLTIHDNIYIHFNETIVWVANDKSNTDCQSGSQQARVNGESNHDNVISV